MTQLMNLVRATAAALAATALLTLAATAHETAVRAPAASFSRMAVRDVSGAALTVPVPHRRVTVLLFLGSDCPVSNAVSPELRRLQQLYQRQGAAFVRIYPEPGLSGSALRRHSGGYGLSGPVVQDAGQRLAAAVGVATLPTAAVLTPHGEVRYLGRIDDRFYDLGRRRTGPIRRDLGEALAAVMAGRAVAVSRTPAVGCPLTPAGPTARAGVPTFHRDIAPILFQQCAPCHRPGQSAPFSLLSYEEARRHARQIALVTGRRVMPPWKADSHGEFVNERRLEPAQIELLRAWATAGAPEGPAAERQSPPRFPGGWQFGEPDAVFAAETRFELPAESPDVYRCFVIPTHFSEDRYLSGVEFRPGNPRIVHHAVAFLDTSGTARKLDAADPGPGFSSSASLPRFPVAGALGAWAPGMQPVAPPSGVGLLLPKGADIVLEVHYHANGKPETDLTRLGVRLCREPVDKRLRCFAVTDLALKIPAGESQHVIRVSRALPADATVYQLTPHMHLLGREMTVTATLPNGTVRRLVRVTDWDFRWQTTYRLREPLALPAGTVISIEARYDNSAANPQNPNRPPREVNLGEQTTDEMCTAYVGLTLDEEHLTRGVVAKEYPLWGIDGL
jgi:mono/diheme cytochrome c family protein